jgi:hypothetical protein
MDFITRSNYQLIEEMNGLLKEAGILNRFTLEIVDTNEEIGVIVYVPSLLNPTKNPFPVEIVENFKLGGFSISQLIESINRDIEDLMKTIKPDILKILRIANAFEYKPEPFVKLDNKKIINVRIII